MQEKKIKKYKTINFSFLGEKERRNLIPSNSINLFTPKSSENRGKLSLSKENNKKGNSGNDIMQFINCFSSLLHLENTTL